MKEKIKKWKKDFEHSQKLEKILKNNFLSKEELKVQREKASFKMIDLKTEILYGERYIEIFIKELINTDIDESEKKYNIKRINEHLEKILKEYAQMTNELDEIIFNKNRKQKICSICGKSYEGYGNNAQPVNSGRCCDVCNSEIVIPRRLQERKNRKV